MPNADGTLDPAELAAKASADAAAANRTVTNNQTPTTPDPAKWVEKLRLDGAMQKIEELTIANRILTEQATSSREVAGTLTASVATKETEYGVKVSDLSTQVATLQQALSEAQVKVALGGVSEARIKVIKDMKRPDLLSLADLLPNTTDEAEILTAASKIAEYADSQKIAREKQLLAGVTPVDNTPPGQQIKTPATADAWIKAIQAIPDGSPEKQAAWDGYFKWIKEN
ncbi:MAG: hypothetical protein ABIL58_22350 [Pseudomonadota bacterium]